MALNLAALAAGAGEPDLLNAFLPAAPVAVRGLPHRAPRMVVPRNDSAVPTIKMFVGGAERNIRFAASIVDACADATTYALRCTSGPAMISPGICGANAEQITVTTNPTFFRVSSAAVTRTMGNDLSATVQGTCRLAETTEAVCAWTVGASVDKTSTITSSTTTYLGTNVYRHDVAITAGAEKTVSPTACAAPIQGSGAAEGMKRVGVWGLVGAMGLVVVMGM